MGRIVIIGGGASGLVAAIYAKQNENEVIVLEKNDICGKKILKTGNGKCNYFNEDLDIKFYNSKNSDLLKDIITNDNKEEILSFFESIGIVPKIKNGYYYPMSEQSSSIKNALVLKAKSLDIEILNNFYVQDITKVNDKFIIKSETSEISADKVVIATGTKASLRKDEESNSYELLRKFNHSIVKVIPSLVQLRGEEKYFKLWDGIRCDVRLNLYENSKKIKEELGQIQLTGYGISGICTFNISGLVSRGLLNNKKYEVEIDFLKDIKKEDEEFIKFLDQRKEILPNRNIVDFFEGMINVKLIKTILKVSKIDLEKKYEELTLKEKEVLSKNIKSFRLKITGTNSFDRAQVCSGGVAISEVNLTTMESLREKNLFITGEVLDVDGCCGGYNLAFAWISGMLAGKECSK